MRFSSSASLCLLAGSLVNALPAPQDSPTATSSAASIPTAASSDIAEAADQLAQLASFASDQVQTDLKSATKKRGTCNFNNVAIRREWSTLSQTERKAYTDAVKCLQSKPARTPAGIAAGAKSRYDDFVVTHINQTMTIHYTGTFLAWHRWFTWTYEQTLRNECGYKGYQPYWNWAKTAITGLENGPYFDGSAYSMGGNGEVVSQSGQIVLGQGGLPPVYLPLGSGGGCVTSGPFKDMQVNLGPVSMQIAGGTTIGDMTDLFRYNPRCLKRDLTDAVNRRFANGTSVVSLILGTDNIDTFQNQMQGIPGTGEIGVHGGGHYSLGGDPGRDFFVSPGDPFFYLHHGMIDRTWWIWQILDRSTRTGATGISGTNTFLNNPPSANTTLDTPISLGYVAGPDVKMRDLMSTTDGPMCYIYI